MAKTCDNRVPPEIAALQQKHDELERRLEFVETRLGIVIVRRDPANAVPKEKQ